MHFLTAKKLLPSKDTKFKSGFNSMHGGDKLLQIGPATLPMYNSKLLEHL